MDGGHLRRGEVAQRARTIAFAHPGDDGCGPGGIHVFDPQGACLGVIRVPEYTANFCFGDDDFRSLFVTASTSLYRLRVKVPGRPQGP